MARKRYKVLLTFGLPLQGIFVEGNEVEVEVAAKKPAGCKVPFMTPRREQELLAEERIELAEAKKPDVGKEVKHGKIQS